METYNAKDKKTGKITNHIKSLTEGSNSYEALVESKTYDQKDKEQSTGEYTITCNSGIVSMDLKKLMPQESLQAYENMDVTFSGENLEMPSVLKAGDKLKDGKMAGEVRDKSSNSIFSTFQFNITDRNVVGKESITTPAGTFDCFKITFNMNMNTSMMGINIPMNMKGVEYITEKAGVVRSEYYNKNGKLGGYTLLSKIDQLSFWLFSVQEFPVPILRNL
jgi:hypothetical protein